MTSCNEGNAARTASPNRSSLGGVMSTCSKASDRGSLIARSIKRRSWCAERRR